jgi:hypothetical protein
MAQSKGSKTTKGKAMKTSLVNPLTLDGDLKALKQMASSANARAALLNHLVASLTKK